MQCKKHKSSDASASPSIPAAAAPVAAAPAAAAAVGRDEGKPWHCAVCTFANHAWLPVCEMCDTLRHGRLKGGTPIAGLRLFLRNPLLFCALSINMKTVAANHA